MANVQEPLLETSTYTGGLSTEGYTPPSESVTPSLITVPIEEPLTAMMLTSPNADDVVSLTDKDNNVSYYTTLEAAIETAKNAPNSTVTLLKDVATTSDVNIYSSCNFTIDLSGKTWTNTSSYSFAKALYLANGTVTIKDSQTGGTISLPNAANGTIIQVSSGASVIIEGGIYEGKTALSTYQNFKQVEIKDGTFSEMHVRQSTGNIKITGGNFSRLTLLAPDAGVSGITSFGQLLANGYAYRSTSPGNPWISQVNTALLENITVQAAPVVITTQPTSLAMAPNSPLGPTLSVTAAATATASNTDLSYQWYKDSNPIPGANSAIYTGDPIPDIGSYSYYCDVTCDGYTLRSNTATVTVSSLTNKDYVTTYTYTGSSIPAPTPVNFTSPTGALVFTWYLGQNEDGSTNGLTLLNATLPTNVGKYTLKVEDIGVVPPLSATFKVNILQGVVSNTGKTLGITYDGNPHNVSDLFTKDPNAGAASYAIVAGGTGTGTLSGSTLTITKPGTIQIQMTTAPNGNYAAGTAVTSTLTISKGTGAGSVSLADWNFGQAGGVPSPASITNGTEHVSYLYKVKEAGDATYTPVLPTLPGNYTVKASFAETDFYDSCFATAYFTINKAAAPALVPPANISMVQGQAKAYTFDLSTLPMPTNAGSKTYTVSTITDTHSLFNTPPTISGSTLSFSSNNKAVSDIGKTAAAVITIQSDNYTDIAVPLTFAIVSRTPVTLSNINVSGKTYDGTPVAYTGTPIAKNGDTDVHITGYDYIWSAQDGTRLSEAPKTAGNYKLTVSVKENNPHYIGSLDIPFTISKKSLLAAAENKTMYYYHNLPNLTIAYNGFIPGESEADAFTFNTLSAATAADGKTIGSYDITLTGTATAENYTLVTQTGRLTVLSRELTAATTDMPASPTKETVVIPPNSIPHGSAAQNLRLSVSYTLTDEDNTALSNAVGSQAGFINKINLEISLIDIVKAKVVQPSGEITLFIPYPTGTNKNDTFKLIHLKSAGSIEDITPQKLESGLKFTVSSLSPFAIGWVKYIPTGGSGSGSSSSGGGSSGGGSGSSYTTYTITATAGTGGSISTEKYVSVRQGDSQTFTFTPDAGYETADVLINGKSVGPAKEYVFKNVSANQTIHVTFKKAAPAASQPSVDFEDVQKQDWFCDAVVNAIAKGWFSGTSKTTFSPHTATTRGMMVTLLYRMTGSPEVPATHDAWYAKGREWAMTNNLSDGTNMNGHLTREQIAALLYRYAQFKGYDTTQGGMAIWEFEDLEEISDYAKTPIAWAAAVGLISGKENGRLDPKGYATRAQVVVILKRFDELFPEK